MDPIIYKDAAHNTVAEILHNCTLNPTGVNNKLQYFTLIKCTFFEKHFIILFEIDLCLKYTKQDQGHIEKKINYAFEKNVNILRKKV